MISVKGEAHGDEMVNENLPAISDRRIQNEGVRIFV